MQHAALTASASRQRTPSWRRRRRAIAACACPLKEEALAAAVTRASQHAGCASMCLARPAASAPLTADSARRTDNRRRRSVSHAQAQREAAAGPIARHRATATARRRCVGVRRSAARPGCRPTLPNARRTPPQPQDELGHGPPCCRLPCLMLPASERLHAGCCMLRRALRKGVVPALLCLRSHGCCEPASRRQPAAALRAEAGGAPWRHAAVIDPAQSGLLFFASRARPEQLRSSAGAAAATRGDESECDGGSLPPQSSRVRT